MIETSCKTKFETFYSHKLTVKLQQESIAVSMQDNKSDNWAKCDWIDVTDTWNAKMIQKHQMKKNWCVINNTIAEFWESNMIHQICETIYVLLFANYCHCRLRFKIQHWWQQQW